MTTEGCVPDHEPMLRDPTAIPGLIGQIAGFILAEASRPVPEIALAAAIGLLSGIAGRSFNTYTNAGLNQYVLVLAPTGSGKDSAASGISKLMAEVSKNVVAAMDFRGPGELVSSAGLMKWLAKKPCCYSVVGEIGILIQQMAAAPQSSHLKGLQKFLLQVYSKSSRGETMDSAAYSDADKVTAVVSSPSYTLIGESVPETFYQALDESMIASGLLPRFVIFEYKGKRSYHQSKNSTPPVALVQNISDVAAQCLSLAHNGNVHVVEADGDAKKVFDKYDVYTTDLINGSNGEVSRQLWNRAHLKALKLASIYAIGVNYINPVIDYTAAMWATCLIDRQTNDLLGKFQRNEVGNIDGDEIKQRDTILRIVGEYCNQEFQRFKTYDCNEEMHKDKVITSSYLSKRVFTLPAFKNDRLGATKALKRVLDRMLEDHELQEMNKQQTHAKYGTAARAFAVANPQAFIKAFLVSR